MSLSDDILWSIFMLNAIDSSERKEQRLRTTRLSSQVCQRWRDLILESSTMWGRLIVIDHKRKERWMEEVLKRAGGSSLLWIQLSWSPLLDANNIPASFSAICTLHWDRVEVLDLQITNTGVTGDRTIQKCWKLMAKPARCLRSVTWRTARSFPENIFGNSAPLLTNIECNRSSINHHYTFLSQIHSLYIKPESIDNLYNILKWTPRLRVLRITSLKLNCLSDDQCSKLASMSPYIIPRLAEIDATLSFKEFNALWSTKAIPLAESFTRHSITCIGTTIAKEDDRFREAVGNFIHNHGRNTGDANDMQLWVTMLRGGLEISLESTSRQLHLRFRIANISLKISEIVLDHFMAHMKNVVCFDFQYPGGDKVYGNLAQSCLSLTKVHTIFLTRISLRWFNRVERPGILLFPRLTMVKWVHDDIRDVDINDMTQFLKRRIEVGWPLPTVSVERYVNSVERYNNIMKAICDGLNNIHGLRITWSFNVHFGKKLEGEYVCGKSEPLEW